VVAAISCGVLRALGRMQGSVLREAVTPASARMSRIAWGAVLGSSAWARAGSAARPRRLLGVDADSSPRWSRTASALPGGRRGRRSRPRAAPRRRGGPGCRPRRRRGC
jgi:hypothetical protein